ncbi:FAD-dependent monooxygenase [Streptomyces sp. NPDC050560]|uniref:FAD-dependent monooxygenase n=1 Tax=Streptomyces sp. NPDC050560 TaxID=3365630 RepID=UPI003787EBF5
MSGTAAATAETEADFCVVGGGPAGLTLALLLLRSGARVALVERTATLRREYRGEILQPGGMRVLDALGVLTPARAQGCHELDRFQLVADDRVLFVSDYRQLPPPYDHLLSIPQQQVLGQLLGRCRRYPGFTFVEGSRVTRLYRHADRVTGALAEGRGGALRIAAHCIVAADGRYSRTRSLAGIASGRDDVFDQDVLWFKVPANGRAHRDVRIVRGGSDAVLLYPSGPDSVQIGWLLPHREYRTLAPRGVEHIKDRVCAAVPQYAREIRHTVRSMADLTLLDVFAGFSPEWAQEGLLLIGDSAHTHSPIGAQGINLALQDAVAAHPVLMASLHEKDAGVAFLERYCGPRRRDIRRMMRLQVAQSRMMLSPGRFSRALRPKMASLVSHTPAYRRILRQIAFGSGTGISSEYFMDGYERLEQECA